MPTLDRMTDKSHGHELVWKKSRVPFECDGCKERGIGYCYECPRKEICNFILHEGCGRPPPSPCIPFFNKCDLKFHRKNPSEGTPICGACGLGIRGFSYQCSRKKLDFHPSCTYLPRTVDGNGVTVDLHKKMKSKCLKCGHKKRRGEVQGWGYASSNGKFSYHIACMKEAWFECWKDDHFENGQVVDNDKRNSRIVQNKNPNQVIRRQNPEAKQTTEWEMMILKLVCSAK